MPFIEDAAKEIIPYYEAFTGKSAKENFEEAVQLFYDNSPECTLSPVELTWHIQKEVPSYHFDCGEANLKKQKALSQKARKALIDLYKKYDESDPFGKYGHDLFLANSGSSVNRSATELGLYIGKFMGKQYKDELKELAERRAKGDTGGDFSERKKNLHRAVIEDAAARAQEMRKSIDGYSMEELVDHLEEIYFFTKICNTGDSVPSSAFSEEEQKKYYDLINPFIMDQWNVMYKVTMLGSPLGEIVDVEQLSQLSRSTLLKISGEGDVSTFLKVQEKNRAQMEDEIERDGKKPDEKTYEIIRNDPLRGLASGVGGLITQINDRVKDKFGASKADHIYQDIDGNNLNEEQMLVELMDKRQPVYVLDRYTPERLPTLVYIEKGQIFLDQKAQEKFNDSPPLTAPHEPYEPYDPELQEPQIAPEKVPSSGIGKRWYGFCGWLESIGLNGLASALRTKDQQEYREHERRLEEYEKKVAPRNARKAAYEKALADHKEKQKERNQRKEQMIGTLLSDENLSAVREKIIQNQFGMNVEQYKEKLVEDARKAAEEEAQRAETRRRDAIRNEQNSYKSEQSKILKEKMKEAKVDKKDQSNYTYLKTAIRNKQFSLFEADGMDKNERVATALVCRRIEQLIDDNLAMMKDGKPMSQELAAVLIADNTDEATKILDQKINELRSDPALQQIAAAMNGETLQKICPAVPDSGSITSIEKVTKELDQLSGLQKKEVQNKQEEYTQQRESLVNSMLSLAGLPDQEAEKIKELSAMVREKQFSLYEANDMDKSERVAAAMTCQLVNNVIKNDLTAMMANDKPLSNALTSLLNSGDIKQKLNEKINELRSDPALQQIAAAMNGETLQKICPAVPDSASITSIEKVTKELDQLSGLQKKEVQNNQEEYTQQRESLVNSMLSLAGLPDQEAEKIKELSAKELDQLSGLQKKEVQNNQEMIGTLLSDENLSAVREKMIQNQFGMNVEQYKEKLVEDARKATEEEAQKAETRRRDAIRSEQNSYRSEQSKILKEKMNKAKVDQKDQSYYTYLKTAIRDKQFSLFEADGMDKNERVATALVCRRIEQLIDGNLAMMNDGKPISQELAALLIANDTDEAAEILNQKINKLRSDPALQQIAAAMNGETLQKICPAVPDSDSIASIEKVTKDLEQEQYTRQREAQVNVMLSLAGLPAQEAEKIKELSAMVREKQFSLYEANDMDKSERVAAAMTCQLVNNVIEDGLTAMMANNKPLSNALTSLLNSGDIKQKLNEKINELQDKPALQQVAAEMNSETLRTICPSAPNIKSILAVDVVLKQLKQVNRTLKASGAPEQTPTLSQKNNQVNFNH